MSPMEILPSLFHVLETKGTAFECCELLWVVLLPTVEMEPDLECRVQSQEGLGKELTQRIDLLNLLFQIG